MKKNNKIFLGMAVITSFALCSFGFQANAEEETALAEQLDVSDLTFKGPQTRATPVIEEVTLESGKGISIKVGGYIDKKLCSKYVIKVNIDSKDRESVVIHRRGQYAYNHDREDSFFFHSNDITLTHSLAEDPLLPGGNIRAGTEIFTIINYSAATLKFKVGVSSGIHVKGQEEFYDDIDFCLQ